MNEPTDEAAAAAAAAALGSKKETSSDSDSNATTTTTTMPTLPVALKHFALILAPQRSVVCDRVLEEEGVAGLLEVFNFPIHFIPFDPDVLTMEAENSFKELFIVRI